MKVFVYSSHAFDRPFLENTKGTHELTFTEKPLTYSSAHLASGYEAIALFTSDDASTPVLEKLSQNGVKFIALRSVGYDHVDLKKAEALGIMVANVPEYSPYSIAEHAVTLLLASNRKITASRLLLQLQDFRLDGLTGFDIHGKTIGIVGTGKIGLAFASIMKGFGTTILAYDPVENANAKSLGVRYVSLEELLRKSDIISIHCPLNDSTKHMFSKPQFDIMKKGCVLINTARGGIVKTEDLIDALENETLRAACLDVYEKEKGVFFQDHRKSILKDPQLARLRNLKNVLITGHQAFLTEEALSGIAETTIQNLDYWQRGEISPNELTTKRIRQANADVRLHLIP